MQCLSSTYSLKKLSTRNSNIIGYPVFYVGTLHLRAFTIVILSPWNTLPSRGFPCVTPLPPHYALTSPQRSLPWPTYLAALYPNSTFFPLGTCSTCGNDSVSHEKDTPQEQKFQFGCSGLYPPPWEQCLAYGRDLGHYWSGKWMVQGHDLSTKDIHDDPLFYLGGPYPPSSFHENLMTTHWGGQGRLILHLTEEKPGGKL